MLHKVPCPSSLMKHTTTLENVQRRATKLILSFKDLDYKERLQRLQSPTLAYHQLRGDKIELYKILTGIYGFVSLITLRDNVSDTRGQPTNIQKIHQSLWLRLHLSNLLREN